MTEIKPLSLTDRLDSEKYIAFQQLPTLSDIQAIAESGQLKQREYGAQLYTTGDKVGCNYVRGYDSRSGNKAIREPRPPERLWEKIQSGVFIHTHPLKEKYLLKKPDVPMGALPSRSGDIPASLLASYIGTYLNVATVYGLVMNIGAEGIDRSEHVVRTLRGRLGVQEQAKEDVWKVWTGERAGDTLADKKGGEFDDNDLLGRENIVIISHTRISGPVSWFLFVSWDKLNELEAVHGGLENICFGDGVQKIVKELSIDVPHGENLSDIVKNPFPRPLERNQESTRPTSSKV
ncbi:hypothetical protein ACFL0Y_01950 [Patescibacteria group bacterium]